MRDFWGRKGALLPPWLMAAQAAGGSQPSGGGASSSSGSVGTGYVAGEQPVPVEFPRHLYAPPGVDTADMRVVRSMDPGESFDLISFRPMDFGIQGPVFITHYAIFNDGLLEDNFSFLPTVNGARIYPFHGNPAKNFLISLGLAPDLSNYALIPGFFVLKPTDQLKWTAFNNDSVQVAMGVRVVGYVDQTSKLMSTRFGG